MENLAHSPLAVAFAAGFVAVILFAVVKVAWGMAQWRKPSTHRVGEGWGDEPVEVIEWSGGEGLVSAGGEIWKARASATLAPGERVKVARVDGLVLEVKKL